MSKIHCFSLHMYLCRESVANKFSVSNLQSRLLLQRKSALREVSERTLKT